VLGSCIGAPGAPSTKPSGKTELAPVSVGSALVIRDILSPTLSYSGNVQARTQVNLVPRISARLEKLSADVGDEVKAGDIIAELDHAQLDAQVQQAEAGLTAAEAKLEVTQASAKQEDVDAAKAVVDQALVRLNQARAGGRPEEVAAAQAQAAQAESKAQQVQAGAREEEAEALKAAIDQAEAQQDQFRAQLASANAALGEANYRLDQARSGQGGPGVRPEDIAQAQATLETNRIKLQQLRNPRAEDIRAAELEVQKARADLNAAEDARHNCGRTTTTTRTRTTDDSGTTKDETRRSRTSCTQADKDELDADIDVARANLRIKEAALHKIRNPSPYDIQQAEQAVASAEANLQKLRYGGTSDLATLELRLAQAQAETERLLGALEQATASAAAARARYEAAVNPGEHDVRQALEAANTARANLAKIANPDPFAVQSAAASVDQANAQLGSRLRPFTEQDIRVAAAGVDQAAASLTAAKVQSAEAIIRAPFDALVSQKLLSPGAMASSNTPILALVSRDVEIVVQVEEARVGQIQRGQAASLLVSAFPGRAISGYVATVSPSADPRSRTFAARVVPSQQDGTLRDGMFAQVNIVGSGQAALMVPNEAIVTRAGRSQVMVVANDRVSAREVKLGETDGKRTAVLEGRLAPGDEVVVTNPELLIDGAPVIVELRNIEPGQVPESLPGSQQRGGPREGQQSGRAKQG
jgi:multidrug efflux pump subunit AcrA (membrane-fusion protein)